MSDMIDMFRPVSRPEYSEHLIRLKDNGNAKALIGIRRCGKSTILSMVAESDDRNIIYIDLDTWEGRKIGSAEDLMKRIDSSLSKDRDSCLFIDEIQNVDGWEEVIRSLIAERKCDIYLSGSNSRLLSGELATYLTGRTSIINIHTLTFKECLRFEQSIGKTSSEVLARFIRTGGFPTVWRNGYSESESYSSINDLYNMIVRADIIGRHRIRNPDDLDRIFDFICGNIGNRTSLNRIFESMHKEDPSINRNSVYDYVPYLEEACLIEHVKEMDLRGRSILTSSYKYYLSDIGLRNARLGFRSDEITGTMENILYLELRSRGYEVYVGNNKGKEIDLVGILNGRRIYIQACVRLSSDSVIEREYGNFKGIEDNWPKYVVVLENSMLDSDLDGIRTMSLEEFLLSDDY